MTFNVPTTTPTTQDAWFDAMTHSAKQSDERRALLMLGIEKDWVNKGFGANVTILSPYPSQKDEAHILDDLKAAWIVNRLKPGTQTPDGIGALGGRGDAGETPIIAVLREMLEEMRDAGLVYAGIDIHGRLSDFIAHYAPQTGLMDTGADHKKVAACLKKLAEQGAEFPMKEGLSLDFKRLKLVPFGPMVDLSFHMIYDHGEEISPGITYDINAISITSPFMFTYDTHSDDEFNHFLTEGKPRRENSEVADIKAISMRDIITRTGGSDFGRTDDVPPVRYVHEGLVAAYVARQNGVAGETIQSLLPVPLMHIAEKVGQSQAQLTCHIGLKGDDNAMNVRMARRRRRANRLKH